jgi:hypothetical protein
MQPRAGTEAYDLFVAMASLRSRLNRIEMQQINTPRQRVAWLGNFVPQDDKAEAQEGDLG